MDTLEQKKVPILEMARGALGEEVGVQLGKIAENILDPNTDYKKARKLVITMEFTTNENRDITNVSATTQTKLVPSKPISTQLAFAADKNGEFCAVELSRIASGQRDIFGGEEPTAQVFEINAAKTTSQTM